MKILISNIIILIPIWLPLICVIHCSSSVKDKETLERCVLCEKPPEDRNVTESTTLNFLTQKEVNEKKKITITANKFTQTVYDRKCFKNGIKTWFGTIFTKDMVYDNYITILPPSSNKIGKCKIDIWSGNDFLEDTLIIEKNKRKAERNSTNNTWTFKQDSNNEFIYRISKMINVQGEH